MKWTVLAALLCIATACGTQHRAEEVAVLSLKGQIAFSSTRGGGVDIYVLDLENGELARLTHGEGESYQPVGSPAGEHLAFTSDRDGDWDVYVMTSGGNEVRNLSQSENWDQGRPSWSPDGTSLIFDARRGELDREIYSFDLATGTTLPITDDEVSDDDPAWSPDGQRVLWVESDRDVRHSLVVMDLQTGRTTRMLEDSRWVSSPVWSPDGEWIAVLTREGLSVIRSDGSERIDDIAGGLDVTGPVWSPDGQWIAFMGSSGLFMEGHGLYVVQPDGSNLRLLVEASTDGQPTWSPDGQWIAFSGLSAERFGDLDIFVVSVIGGEAINLTQHRADDRFPDWFGKP